MAKREQRLRNYLKKLTVEKSDANETAAESFIDLDRSSIESRIGTTHLARNDEERDLCLSAHRKLTEGTDLSDREQFFFEAIVLPTERPAVLIRDNSYERPPSPWGSLDSLDVRSRLETSIRSVGRVELVGTNSPPYAGTAFVVGPGLLMTNQHVARLFSTGHGSQIRFRDGLGSAVDFVRENGNDAQDLYAVAEVLMWHPYWDMALLRVDSLPVKPLNLLPRHPEECRNRKIAVIGYPAQDPRGDQAVQQRIFGADFGVKRFQPGFAVGQREFQASRWRPNSKRATLEHDASTLGGNSGSAVIDVETGHVVGLHFAGRYEDANFAVPAFELGRDSRVRDAGVQFADGVSEAPNPWKTQWAMTESTPSPVPSHPTTSTVKSTTECNEIVANIPIQISIRVGATSSKTDDIP